MGYYSRTFYHLVIDSDGNDEAQRPEKRSQGDKVGFILVVVTGEAEEQNKRKGTRVERDCVVLGRSSLITHYQAVVSSTLRSDMDNVRDATSVGTKY
jgi:hypothetical protein